MCRCVDVCVFGCILWFFFKNLFLFGGVCACLVTVLIVFVVTVEAK